VNPSVQMYKILLDEEGELRDKLIN